MSFWSAPAIFVVRGAGAEWQPGAPHFAGEPVTQVLVDRRDNAADGGHSTGGQGRAEAIDVLPKDAAPRKWRRVFFMAFASAPDPEPRRPQVQRGPPRHAFRSFNLTQSSRKSGANRFDTCGPQTPRASCPRCSRGSKLSSPSSPRARRTTASLPSLSRSLLAALVTSVAAVSTAPAIATQSDHGWRLHVVRTGEQLGTYQDFTTCIQATATRSNGELACKPATDTSTAAPTTTEVTPEAPSPAILQPATTAAPVMSAGLQIDASALPLPDVGLAFDRVQATSETAPASDIGAFRTTCDFSHMAFDDPIVYPGQAGAAHLHTFFGNTGTNANSTAESLRSTGNSTCRGGTINRTAYWVPAMIDMTTRKPLRPDVGNFYYKQGYSLTPSSVIQPLPAGLRMIAGDPRNAAPGGTD